MAPQPCLQLPTAGSAIFLTASFCPETLGQRMGQHSHRHNRDSDASISWRPFQRFFLRKLGRIRRVEGAGRRWRDGEQFVRRAKFLRGGEVPHGACKHSEGRRTDHSRRLSSGSPSRSPSGRSRPPPEAPPPAGMWREGRWREGGESGMTRARGHVMREEC